MMKKWSSPMKMTLANCSRVSYRYDRMLNRRVLRSWRRWLPDTGETVARWTFNVKMSRPARMRNGWAHTGRNRSLKMMSATMTLQLVTTPGEPETAMALQNVDKMGQK